MSPFPSPCHQPKKHCLYRYEPRCPRRPRARASSVPLDRPPIIRGGASVLAELDSPPLLLRILQNSDAHPELCVCQVIELLGLAPSTVSKHLSILKQARLIDGRKHGRWMYYRLADEDVPTVAKDAISWALNGLGRDRQRLQDAERLIQILAMDPEVLCLTQRERA